MSYLIIPEKYKPLMSMQQTEQPPLCSFSRAWVSTMT